MRHRGHFRCWWLGALGALALVWATSAQADPGPGTYYIRPLGAVDPAQARYACRIVREAFQLRCVVLRARPLPQRHLRAERQQYDADGLIDVLFRDLPTDGVGLMGLTNADLADARRPRFVFGLASLVDRVGVVSLARFRNTWWGTDPDPARFRARLRKVLVHEVGHTLGLEHCPNPHCVMRDDADLEALDQSPEGFCRRCRGGVADGRRVRPGTARWHYLRGHAHLGRGQHPQAVFHLQLAAELDPLDALAANDLGVAYLRRGDGGRALWWLRHARKLAPGLPNAAFNEGLIYLSVSDHQRAREAFEAVLTVDPSWALAHKQLGLLYDEFLAKPTEALAHYQAYLDLERGQDRDVEARIRLIKGGGEPHP
ncbi:MAG: tetratricopeptide repeat protein [Myxococcales bacterium]|nr:tetratricopeptide repeat protein [Myxococcales bacterium]MCB9522756.1 tetratricopeptide repeat protein [Myxococcales bacterium]